VADAPLLPPGTLLAGKFRIERLLGAGAMGAVYAIDHELTHHKRALKLLHPDLRMVPDLVRRFLNEASAAGRAGSPHLVETFDAGTLPTGEPYVVMELLEGETLGSLLVRERVVAPERAAELVAQAAEGIEAAHGAGIIHRDLKPDNLFVTIREGFPFVKILDFGVSKFATGPASDMRKTRAGMVYGSPAYMSPEQLTGQVDLDQRADVFALGVVLFQCLTGALPYDGPTLEAFTARLLTGDPTRLETLRPDVPPALVDVVYRAMARTRDERIPTARALAIALGPFRSSAGRAEFLALGHAKTVASLHPMFGTTSRPAGLPRPRRTMMVLLVAGGGALLVAIALAGLVSRTKTPSTASSTVRPAVAESSAPPVPTTPETLLPALEPTAVSAVVERGGPAPEARKPPSAPTGSTSATARPSAAQNLGLREDNPFR
jgi:serine/threonine protein kinase